MKLSEQIQVLGEKIDYISQNTQFTLSITIGVLGLAVAIAGIALYKLSISWVNKAVKDELENIKKELKEDSHKFILDNTSYIIRTLDYVPVTTKKTKDDEYRDVITVDGGSEKLLNPPIVSLYRINEFGEKVLYTDYYLAEELYDYPKNKGENKIYICMKNKSIGYLYSYIVMWEKARNNEKVRV